MPYDGLGPGDLAARIKAPGCLSLVKVTSTLDVIHELAAEGAPEGTVVLADEQVAGRGRHGRRWHSPPGTGIWMGFLARPRRARAHGVVSIRVGLAIADALDDLGVRVWVKWPNDVVAEDGRKLAGVLCESRWEGDRPRWVAVGVGINVHEPLPHEIAASAVAVCGLRPNTTRVDVLERLVPRLLALTDAATLAPDERAAFAGRDWLFGRTLREPLAGRARGIDPDGGLLVETGDGMRGVRGGDVVTA